MSETYTKIPFIGQIGTSLEDNNSADLVTDIAVLSLQVKDDFSYFPVDYKPVGAVWTRKLLDPRYAYPYEYSSGTIAMTFFSKLKTKQPVFYVDKTDTSRRLWIKIIPTVASPFTPDGLESVQYRGVKCIQGSMSQETIGEYKLMVGSVVYQYLYKKFAEL
jgi:hypothetical protein